MVKTVIIAISVLLLVTVRAHPMLEKTDYEVIQLEEACAMQGGLCLRNDDCPPDNKAMLGSHDVLCPLQRHLGVVCCYM